MSENLPAPSKADFAEQIAELTRGLALLDRTRADHVYELGRKLIPIRQLLQATNGTRGHPGVDGLHPAGWIDWCRKAGIPKPTASEALHRAANPDKDRALRSCFAREGRRKPTALIRALGRAWPTWSFDERAKVVAAVRQLVQESNNAEA